MSKNDKKNMTKWNRAAVAVNEAGTKVKFVEPGPYRRQLHGHWAYQ